MKFHLGLTVATVLVASSGLACSDDTPPGPHWVKVQPGRSGTAAAHSRQSDATFIVHLTDFDNKDVPGQDFHPLISNRYGRATSAPLVPAVDGPCNDCGLLDGVTFFNLVNLAVYMHAIPVFAESDVFNILNAQVAVPPGMPFSTTPISFDPVNGPTDLPYTGHGDRRNPAPLHTDHD